MDAAQRAERRRVFLSGVRDGVPIGLGYLAVAFSLGIAARNAGLNALQGFLISLLNNASAGEYAAFTVIAADSGFLEMALITLITNARYLLMSCSLSQKFSPDTPLHHRLLVGYDVTDELFGIAIARPGYLDPFYSYGAFLPAIPGWAIGTALGVTAGSILPARLVSALSVALFGMFLAIIIPPSKKNPVVLGCVAVSFAASWLCTVLPLTKALSEGTRTILLTILIASAATVEIAPVVEEGMKLLPLVFYLLVFEPEPGRLKSAAVTVALSFATFENVCYLIQNGADRFSFIFFRGFGTGAMHVLCGMIVGRGLAYAWQRTWLKIAGTCGLLGAAITFHAIYNLLIAYGGTAQYIAYALPVLLVAAGKLRVLLPREAAGPSERS